MKRYKLSSGGGVQRDDGLFIPEDLGNADWRKYQEWLLAGNTPDPSETRDESVLRVWGLIKAKRDQRKSEGGVKVGTKWFHSDDASRIQQIGLVMMGASIPANTQWKTMDGSFVTMTQTLAGQIFQASAANDMAIFAAAETHKAAMEASADPASYDFSQGWPKAFGEP